MDLQKNQLAMMKERRSLRVKVISLHWIVDASHARSEMGLYLANHSCNGPNFFKADQLMITVP